MVTTLKFVGIGFVPTLIVMLLLDASSVVHDAGVNIRYTMWQVLGVPSAVGIGAGIISWLHSGKP